MTKIIYRYLEARILAQQNINRDIRQLINKLDEASGAVVADGIQNNLENNVDGLVIKNKEFRRSLESLMCD